MKQRASQVELPVVFGVLIITYIILGLTIPGFFTAKSLEGLLTGSSTLALVSMGLTMVMVSGGIDLSAGSVLALSGTVTGLLLNGGVSISAAVIAGLACGFITGLLNGLLISMINLNPFLTTLGTLAVARGACRGFDRMDSRYFGSSDYYSRGIYRGFFYFNKQQPE